jgi:Lrp/AsnC family transcriptional regulator, leucine-responsive regulatory protein
MLDAIDARIVQALLDNARVSLKDLASQVDLSSPSVAERLRRLQEQGVIRAFTIDIDPRALGYPLQAIVRIRPLPGKLHLVQAQLDGIPEIGECDKVTGEDCFFARLYVRSIEQLDAILDRIADKAETNTAIIKSQPIARRLPPLLSESGERMTAPRRRAKR